MKQIVITTILLTLGGVGQLFAGHIEAVHRNYGAELRELNHQVAAMRDAARHEFHHTRKALIAQRKTAYRIDCPHTRADQVRAINEELGHVARGFSRKMRRISEWHQDAMHVARREFEIALRDAKRTRVVVHRPPIVEQPGTCKTNRGRLAREFAPVDWRDDHGVHRFDEIDPRYAPVQQPVTRRSPRAEDWVGFALSMLLRNKN